MMIFDGDSNESDEEEEETSGSRDLFKHLGINDRSASNRERAMIFDEYDQCSTCFMREFLTMK